MLHSSYAALLAALVLVHVPRLVVSREMAKLPGGYDNQDPRAQQLQLAGVGRRALGAHNNAMEAFAPFAVGVLAALGRGVRADLVACLAIAFVALRAIYLVAYLGNRPSLRSSMWALALLVNVALMVLAVAGGPRA